MSILSVSRAKCIRHLESKFEQGDDCNDNDNAQSNVHVSKY